MLESTSLTNYSVFELLQENKNREQKHTPNWKTWKNRQIEENIIEYVINLLRLKKENEVIKDRIIKDARNHFKLKQENAAMKDRII